MNAKPQPIRSVDQLVGDYVEIQEQISALTDRANNIKAQLVEQIGIGERAVGDVKVSVREPNRRFNLDKAWSLLTDEQKALCVTPDATKVRRQLAPALADTCYDAGTGAPILTVR